VGLKLEFFICSLFFSSTEVQNERNSYQVSLLLKVSQDHQRFLLRRLIAKRPAFNVYECVDRQASRLATAYIKPVSNIHQLRPPSTLISPNESRRKYEAKSPLELFGQGTSTSKRLCTRYKFMINSAPRSNPCFPTCRKAFQSVTFFYYCISW
jgi:hypothetical protein